MITRYNQDGSYFQVSIFGSSGIEAISKDVLSLTIEEEFGKMTGGTITFRDDNQGYSKVISQKYPGLIEWGFKDPLKAIQNLLPDPRNPVEIKGPPFRKGLKVVFLSPSGAMNDNGTGTYSTRFRAAYSTTEKKKTRNFIGIRASIVAQIFTENLIVAPFILFASGGTAYMPDGPLKQENETDFQFLQRCARQWKCIFSIGNTLAGVLTAQFCDPLALNVSPYKTLVTGGSGFNNFFAYKGSARNVLNATWEHNLNEDGTGDSLQFTVIAGQSVGIATSLPRETVVIRKLNMEKLKKDMEQARARGGVDSLTKLYTAIVTATTFDDPNISRYWPASEVDTAPTGGGWKVGMSVFGSPMYLPGNFVNFGDGFPEVVQDNLNMKMQKVTHELSEKGFFNKIECSNQSLIGK